MPDRKLYAVDVQIAATGYIKARSRKEAAELADKMFKDATLEVEAADGEVEISGVAYDSPDFPPVSLSPAMTIVHYSKPYRND